METHVPGTCNGSDDACLSNQDELYCGTSHSYRMHCSVQSLKDTKYVGSVHYLWGGGDLEGGGQKFRIPILMGGGGGIF